MDRFGQLLHRIVRALFLRPLREILNDSLVQDTIVNLRRVSNEDAADYISKSLLSEETMVFSNTQHLRNHFFSEVFLTRPGLILDFGVAEGHSTLQIARELPPGKTVHAFDAFEGLRNPWSKPDTPPHAIDLGGIIPPEIVGDSRINCVVGWVEDTLPDFLRETGVETLALVHLDMDVFAPTLFVLESLAKRLQKGSIIVFDDYFDFPGWRNHSHKALTSVLNRSDYKVLGVSPRQLAIEII